MRVRCATKAAIGALACCLVLAPPSQAAPGDAYALGVGASTNSLTYFNVASPAAVTSVPVTGLPGFVTLRGIDFRPATGELYGVGTDSVSNVYLFTIDPLTGVATSVGSPLMVALVSGATAFGVSFNPTVDRIRVVDDLDANFRLHPTTGFPLSDDPINYSQLPDGAANAPLTALAYDRSVVPTTASTAFGIAAGKDRLVRLGGVDGQLPSPNSGILFDVGLLGVDASPNAGLDIDPTTNTGYAALEVGGSSGLYTVNLSNGAAAFVGTIGTGVTQFASLAMIATTPVPPSPPPPAVALESLQIFPRAFRASKSGAATASKARKAPLGARVAYTLSTTATVTFAVERLLPGRKKGAKCVKPIAANRKLKRCTRVVALKPSFAHSSKEGENSFKFRGRLGKKSLSPGHYRLLGTAGASTKRAAFKIVP